MSQREKGVKNQPSRNFPGLRWSNPSTRRNAAMTAENATGSNPEACASYARPNINVTPLIDVLLVMLIIFMVVSPLKPARFLAKVPSQPDQTQKDVRPDPNTLVVTIKIDRTLMLNGIA